MTEPAEVVTFDPDAPEEVVVQMRALASAHAGWLNVTPAVPPEQVAPPAGGLGPLFGGRGPQVPLATWMPGSPTKQGTIGPTQLGIQHGWGRQARPRLAELGLWPWPGWWITSDNARRGIVVEAPDGGDPAEQLDWLVTASLALTSVEVPRAWRATVYR